MREESERGSHGESSSSDDDDDGAGPSGEAGPSFIDVRAIESTSGAAREVRIFASETRPQVLTGLTHTYSIRAA